MINKIFSIFILSTLLIGEDNISSKAPVIDFKLDSNEGLLSRDPSGPPLDFKLDSNIDSNIENENILNPARPISPSFVAFSVGYHFLHNEYYKTHENKNGIFFAIEKGWLLVNDILMLSIILDGSAGDFYSANGGFKVGARVWDGRIIPSFSLGFGVINRDIDNKQYNAIGTTGSLGIFIDIASGFGVELGYKFALHPFIILENNLKNNKINAIHNFMFNLRFMYF